MIAELIPTISFIKEKINNEIKGKVIYLTLSGAHLYGMESVDSDYDIRGCFLQKTEALLGLKLPKDQLQTTLKEQNADIDIFEMRKELGLLVKSNCNVLEHLFATPLYSDVLEHSKLKQLIRHLINKNGLYGSYRGMAYFNYKKFILGNQPTVKKYLYVFRALLAGIYALNTGQIEPNIEKLNQSFDYENVTNLIELKKHGEEKSKTGRNESHDKLIDDLFIQITNAFEASWLPESPNKEDYDAVDEYLKNLRKNYLD